MFLLLFILAQWHSGKHRQALCTLDILHICIRKNSPSCAVKFVVLYESESRGQPVHMFNTTQVDVAHISLFTDAAQSDKLTGTKSLHMSLYEI